MFCEVKRLMAALLY